MGRLEGKVALITGAARGQGRSHAVRFAQEGADVVAIDLPVDSPGSQKSELHYRVAERGDLDRTVEMVEGAGRSIHAETVDVRDRVALAEAVGRGVERFGALHVVVANAGICPLGEGLPTSTFNTVVDVNFGGVLHTVTASLPHIGAGASIIVTGSVAAFREGSVDGAGPGGAGYRASKHFVAQYVHDLARVIAPERIRVNAVHPTNVDTDMLHNDALYRRFRPDLENPTRDDAIAAFPAMTAMGIPWVDPADISNAVLFLASDESRYITGVQLRVDAGLFTTLRPEY